MPRSLKIGIDGSRIVRRHATGTENYSEHIIRGLLALEPEDDIRVYLNRSRSDLLPEWLPSSKATSIPAPGFWTHGRLSLEMLRNRPDVLFVPAHVIPIVHPVSIVTIHDLGYLHFPDAHPVRQRRMLNASTRWSAKSARAVIVPSQFTADDLNQRLRVPESAIHVIPHGVDPRFAKVAPSHIEGTRRALSIEQPYVLAVGTIQPRKNLGALARAVKMARDHGLEVDLLIAGKPGWNVDRVEHDLLAANLHSHLRILEYVDPDHLAGLYAGCELFVQPSLFEGFGMPVLEAMAAGTPVISSSASSLPEVGGDAAAYADPDDVEHLAELIQSILGSSTARERMIAAGRGRSREFTWERAARATRDVLIAVTNR